MHDIDRIFINQTKYTNELCKKFDLNFVSSSPTPMSMTTKLDHDEMKNGGH